MIILPPSLNIFVPGTWYLVLGTLYPSTHSPNSSKHSAPSYNLLQH